MTASMNDLLASAKSLSLDERYELIDALVALDEPPEGELVGEAFLAELKRRSDAIDRGESTAIPFEEMIRNAQARHGIAPDA